MEEKKVHCGQFNPSLNLLHLRGLTCTGEGHRKIKINLQLKKNTILMKNVNNLPLFSPNHIRFSQPNCLFSPLT